jgi:hypothetical protein
MPEDRTRSNVLARITADPQLALAVPHLPPEVLHLAIAHFGLQDCSELLTLATPAQLTAVFDLDLWKADRAGADEQFDASRFCEWLEVLVDAGPEIAADRVSKMDEALVVAGLSPQIKVFDSAVFSPVAEESGADPTLNAGRERGVHAEIGGYLVVARRTDGWDVIVSLLVALAEQHSGTFHRVMRGCRSLSDSGWEIDGLDNLLSDAGHRRFDLSQSREGRRTRLGFLPADQARAFLDSARRVSLTASAPPHDDFVFGAYQRALEVDESNPQAAESDSAQTAEPSADAAPSTAAVIDVLREGGVLADASRALLPGTHDVTEPVTPALHDYLRGWAESDAAGWVARNQELAFLANALVAGSSVQARPFTPREATDAIAATCNLGLDCWPRRWPAASTHDLVMVFRVGWTTLHNEVSVAAAKQVIHVLDGMQISDRDLQFELRALRRELRQQLRTGTPWRARRRLDVLATLDLPAWAALMALFDECPVMLSNVSASGDRQQLTVNPSEFRFIADAGNVAAVHAFLKSLPSLLTT